MQRRTWIEWVVFGGVVAAGAQLRVVLQDIPNFAPVAAIALFSGYFFRSRLMALAAPLSVMALADLQLGGYDPRLMLLVYAMLALPVACRGVLRRKLAAAPGPIAAAAGPAAGLLGCSLACSVLFFLATNFGCWLWSGMYEPTWAGLARCYAMALPFFRYTVAGDLSFAVILFGGYLLAVNRGWLEAPRRAAAAA